MKDSNLLSFIRVNIKIFIVEILSEIGQIWIYFKTKKY